MSPEILGGISLLGFGLVYVIGFILSAIGSWKVFTKCGEAGWKAFIPFYNKFVRFNLYWDKKFFWVYLVTHIVTTTAAANASGILGLIIAALAITGLVVTVKMEMKCARCFGKGTGMGILLIIMPWLANLILGFGKAEYTAIEK